ncbi:uncharacterized protein BJX67DRAFT_23613 [Aspergillus lucknowensis]|uniref:Uncharacterized protein n=1 Tax=Aspergillus lucknowensis TaxID=176173 RepID=A0ABR4LXK5_9EURO
MRPQPGSSQRPKSEVPQASSAPALLWFLHDCTKMTRPFRAADCDQKRLGSDPSKRGGRFLCVEWSFEVCSPPGPLSSTANEARESGPSWSFQTVAPPPLIPDRSNKTLEPTGGFSALPEERLSWNRPLFLLETEPLRLVRDCPLPSNSNLLISPSAVHLRFSFFLLLLRLSGSTSLFFFSFFFLCNQSLADCLLLVCEDCWEFLVSHCSTNFASFPRHHSCATLFEFPPASTWSCADPSQLYSIRKSTLINSLKTEYVRLSSNSTSLT